MCGRQHQPLLSVLVEAEDEDEDGRDVRHQPYLRKPHGECKRCRWARVGESKPPVMWGVGWRWLLGWNQKMVSVWSYCGKIFPWADFQWRNFSFSSSIIFMHTQEIPFSFISFSFLVFVPFFLSVLSHVSPPPSPLIPGAQGRTSNSMGVHTPVSTLISPEWQATHLCLSRSFSIPFHFSMIFYIVLHLSTSAHLPDL